MQGREDIKDAQARPFEWFLSPPLDNEGLPVSPLVNRVQTDSPLVWISGKAGSGKSTLMKYLYWPLQLQEFLQIRASGSPSILSGFLFYERGVSVLQRSREGLMRAMLHQVLEQRPDLASIIVGSQRINLEVTGLRRTLDHKE